MALATLFHERKVVACRYVELSVGVFNAPDQVWFLQQNIFVYLKVVVFLIASPYNKNPLQNGPRSR